MPDMMGTTGYNFDSQIFVDYTKIQSEFSLHLNIDIDYFSKWAFEGKPFPKGQVRNGASRNERRFRERTSISQR